jgi:hypothetical protein
MRFSIVDKALHVSSDTPLEALEIIKHYKLDTLQHAEALGTGQLTHICKPGRNNGEWFAVSSVLGADWIAPYLKRLVHLTGFPGPVPRIPGPKYPGGYAENLCHTHIVESVTLGEFGLEFHGFVHSADWNGRTAAQRYQACFDECVREAVGDTKREPEFVHVGNGGLMRHNPNYLKRHAPHPAATSARILECLMSWWLENRATPCQRDIIAQCIANHRTVCPRDGMGEYFLRMHDQGYRTSWGGPLVSFDEFKGA